VNPDKSGNWTESGIQAGSRTISAAAPGYDTVTTLVNVLAGKTVTLPAALTLSRSKGAVTGKVQLVGQPTYEDVLVTMDKNGKRYSTSTDVTGPTRSTASRPIVAIR